MFGFLTRGPGNTGYVQFDNDARPRTAAFKEVWRHGLRAVNNLWPGNYQRLPEAVGFEMSDLSNTPLKELAKAFKDAFVDLQPQTELTDVQIGLIKGLANLNTAELIEISDHMGGQAQFKEKIFSLMSINQHGSNPDIQSCLARLQHPEIELEHPIIDLKDAAPPLPNSDGPLVKHGGLGMTFGGLNTPVVDVNAMVESRGGETVTVYSTTAEQLLKDVRVPDKVRQYLSGLPGVTEVHAMPLSDRVRINIGSLDTPTREFNLPRRNFEELNSGLPSPPPQNSPFDPTPANQAPPTSGSGRTTSKPPQKNWETTSGVAKFWLEDVPPPAPPQRKPTQVEKQTGVAPSIRATLDTTSVELHTRALETAAIISQATARVINGETTDIFQLPHVPHGIWNNTVDSPRNQITSTLTKIIKYTKDLIRETQDGEGAVRMDPERLTSAQSRHLKHAENFLKCLQNCGSDTTFLTLSRTILAHLDQVIDTKVATDLTIENVNTISETVYSAISGKNDFALSIRPDGSTPDGSTKKTAMYTILYGGHTTKSEATIEFGYTDEEDFETRSEMSSLDDREETDSDDEVPTHGNVNSQIPEWTVGLAPKEPSVVQPSPTHTEVINGGTQKLSGTKEELLKKLSKFLTANPNSPLHQLLGPIGEIPTGTRLTLNQTPGSFLLSWVNPNGDKSTISILKESLGPVFDKREIQNGNGGPASSNRTMPAIADVPKGVQPGDNRSSIPYSLPESETIEDPDTDLDSLSESGTIEDPDTDLDPEVIVPETFVIPAPNLNGPAPQLSRNQFVDRVVSFLASSSFSEPDNTQALSTVLGAIPPREEANSLSQWVAKTNEQLDPNDYLDENTLERFANRSHTQLYMEDIRVRETFDSSSELSIENYQKFLDVVVKIINEYVKPEIQTSTQSWFDKSWFDKYWSPQPDSTSIAPVMDKDYKTLIDELKMAAQQKKFAEINDQANLAIQKLINKKIKEDSEIKKLQTRFTSAKNLFATEKDCEPEKLKRILFRACCEMSWQK